ncbi:histidine kinase [Streptomyces sp. ACA25]|uniref:sensor histidine kinase n=1 Tax=Streptomyces sp. ACA25 TaxID=3022596 RepID=UPI002306EDD0|nr:histidine kinase [Streptomyces sp. ACA25]MDB1088007.1 histidine kinase [Streptomyces sp. ACA25]
MTETAAPPRPHGRAQHWVLPGEMLTADRNEPVRRTARDWLVDSLLFGWAVLLWLLMLQFVAEADYLPGWVRTVDPVLGALSCLALWWRRRFPMALALFMVIPGMFSSTIFGVMMVVILNLALRVPLRPALLVLGLHLVAVTPYVVLYTVPYEGGWVSAAFTLAYYLVFFTWGTTMAARRQLVLRLREDAERERGAHARRLADTRRVEREAIAREMHDVLAHRISLLSVHAGALAYRTGRSADGAGLPLSEAEVGHSAQVIRDNAHQALEELREVLTVLRGSASADGGSDALSSGRPQPGIGDVSALVEEARTAGERVTCSDTTVPPAAEALRPQVQRTVFRVVQEGLTNARKHAPGERVTVALAGGPGRGLTVEVVNPLPGGVTAAEIPGAGAGLTGLEERTALDGGSLEFGSTDGTFRLRATLPWAA